MIKKSLILGIGALTISAIAVTGVITSNVQTNRDEQDVTFDPVPPVLLENHKHPNALYTEDGFYVKKQVGHNDHSKVETVNDSSNTNGKTKMIIQNGDVYVKEENTM
ncbi:hypothetical protein ACFCP7_09675 [Paenibacillus elgii]